MRVIRDRPPLFDEIDAKFKVRGLPVLFAWGSIIYVPSGSLEVFPHLMAHEEVHGGRQGNSEGAILAWWRLYLDDPKFRLAEEILAHRAEYEHLLRNGGGRQQRRRHLAVTAARLAAPLYGRLISVAEAKKALEVGK